MVQAIIAGLITRDEADIVIERLWNRHLPDKPSEIYDDIMGVIEQVRRDATALKRAAAPL